MKTHISQPMYQESLAINRTIQDITRGYHSNGTFNLAFKIKDDIIGICNDLDLGVSARFEHTFISYYEHAFDRLSLLLEHIRIANSARMIRGGFPSDLIERIRLLRWRIKLVLELVNSEVPLDYITLSSWARKKLELS
jgi:hypothetical protein